MSASHSNLSSLSFRFIFIGYLNFSVEGKTGINCSMCDMITFCSKACKEESIESHLEECRYLRKLGNLRYFLDDQVLLLLRLYLKVRNEEKNAFECYTIGDELIKRPFSDLMDRKLVN